MVMLLASKQIELKEEERTDKYTDKNRMKRIDSCERKKEKMDFD